MTGLEPATRSRATRATTWRLDHFGVTHSRTGGTRTPDLPAPSRARYHLRHDPSRRPPPPPHPRERAPCPREDSNLHCAGFEPAASTSWATRARVLRGQDSNLRRRDSESRWRANTPPRIERMGRDSNPHAPHRGPLLSKQPPPGQLGLPTHTGPPRPGNPLTGVSLRRRGSNPRRPAL